MSESCGDDVIERLRERRREAEVRFEPDPHRPRGV